MVKQTDSGKHCNTPGITRNGLEDLQRCIDLPFSLVMCVRRFRITWDLCILEELAGVVEMPMGMQPKTTEIDVISSLFYLISCASASIRCKLCVKSTRLGPNPS